MNRAAAVIMLAAVFIMAFCVPWLGPDWLADKNTFLKEFVNYNLLSILGVILAITVAAASQMHLKFNDIEERAGKEFLHRSRLELKSSIVWLLALFAGAVFLVVVKPILAMHGLTRLVAIANGMSLFVPVFYILVLADFTRSTFSIPPLIKSGGEDH